MSELLDFCLSYVVEQKGSDVHIVEGYPPYARIKGDLVKIPFRYPVVDRSMIETAVRKILKTEGAISRLYERDEIDLTYEHKGERFRVNVAIAQGKIFLAIRYLEETIPPPHELGVPKEFTDVIIKHSYGVAFLVGPTGSGKSTTLVSCISYMLSKVARRVVTIEDPVEYMITPGKGIVTQREVGRDTKAFSSALRAAMREDPDVILVGEVRDTETALNCLSAAETGHLVVTTLHTGRAHTAINRFVGMFPPQEQNLVRQRLAESILAVLAHRLVPDPKGYRGRRLVTEFLDCRTQEIKEMILEKQMHQIELAMKCGKAGWCFPEDVVC